MANPFHLIAESNIPAVLSLLQTQPSLINTADAHGYTLLHAAVSYNHISLIRHLVSDLQANVNIRDEDGETPLFFAESVEMAKVLVEELGAEIHLRNEDGLDPAEKMEDDGDCLLVAAYLRDVLANRHTGNADGVHQQQQSSVQPLPPPPPNVEITVGTMTVPEEGGGETRDGDNNNQGTAAVVVDEEFKRRIERLAARDDFRDVEGQKELRTLVTEAVRGHVVGSNRLQTGTDQRDTARRRVA